MKTHHVLLTLTFAGFAAFLLTETFSLKERKTALAGELELLRGAAKKPSAGAKNSNPAARTISRSPTLDTEKFLAELGPLLDKGREADGRKKLADFFANHEALINSAPTSKLKELCASLETGFTSNPQDSAMVRHVWTAMLGKVAKSDPDWAIAKFDEVATALKAPLDAVLQTFSRWASQEGGTMSPAYAAALNRWLNQAQSEGRFDGGSPALAKLRTEIAVAEGNVSGAVKEIGNLPGASQREAAASYIEKLQTPAESRQALEELSSVLHFQSFQVFASSLSRKEGFDTARQILSSASLTPEKHDLAAASIASAKIGPETRERAAWLWENLKSDDTRALENFAENWSKGDHPATATWLNTLPAGDRRDAALKGFIPTTANLDGATAMDWALSISQPSLRSWMYDVAYRKWKETDPARAEAYRQAKPLHAAPPAPQR